MPPPGSPSQRPVNAATYQAAVAAASAARPPPAAGPHPTTAPAPAAPNVPTGMVQPGPTPGTSGAPIRPPAPQPPTMLPNAALVHHQQRQALLNRRHQIGNYLATMHQHQQQPRPPVMTASPLLRPPVAATAHVTADPHQPHRVGPLGNVVSGATPRPTPISESTTAAAAAAAATAIAPTTASMTESPALPSSPSKSPSRILTRRSSQAK